jgi:hypothetical protein
LTTPFTTPTVDAVAGTELPSCATAVATVDPTALTVLPTVGAAGATGLVLPGGAGERVAPLLLLAGELPEAAGGDGVPV